jgi:hypothetical protein
LYRVYQKGIGVSVFRRLQYLFEVFMVPHDAYYTQLFLIEQVQNWASSASSFWIKHFVALILSVLSGTQDLVELLSSRIGIICNLVCPAIFSISCPELNPMDGAKGATSTVLGDSYSGTPSGTLFARSFAA